MLVEGRRVKKITLKGKKMMKKLLTILTVFCLMFTSIPMMAGTFESNALAKNITLKASATGTSTAKLTWNKCKSPNSGYAVFRNGTAIGHYNTKKTSYSDSGLASGTSYTYQIKTYKKTKKTQWYNKKTGKWQSKKPAKKYRGKSRKVTNYSYKKKSNAVTIRTNYIYYNITWKNWDGSVLAKDSVKKGTTPSYSGSTPTRAADSNYTYTFKGWSPSVSAATGDQTYTAQFTKKEKPATTYTITWKNWNGNTLRTDTVKAGVTPSYGGTPTRPEDSNYTYTFKEWSPSVVAATSNATYTAQYNATAKPTGPTYYTIIWKNWDGSTLKTDSVEKGKMPAYTGTPTRPEDSNYIYNFNGWSPSVVAATANATYTAQYTATAKPAGTTYYTITWKNWDGTTLKTDSVKAGTVPSYSGSTPTKSEDSYYTYTFSGWNPSPTAATANTTYKAKFTAKSKYPVNVQPSQYNYRIRFINEPYGNGGKTAYFIETNNPNPYNLSANIVDSNGNDVSGFGLGVPDDLADVQFTDEDEFFVGNGIPMIQSPRKAGTLTVVVYEENTSTGTSTPVCARTVNVKDYKSEETAWRNRVIQNVCSDSMTNKEKMQEICGYLLLNFKYLKNNSNGYVYLLTDASVPYWIRKEVDSATSPALLVQFGSDLGYPLKNMYGEYTPGTSEWQQFHMYAYSEADDTYFQACPNSSTGTVSSSDITMFNPNTYQFWGE